MNRTQAPIVLEHIVEQPLPFVIDVADDPVDTAFLVDAVRPPERPVRSAGKELADADWVAIATWKPTGQQKVCGGYGRTPGVPGHQRPERHRADRLRPPQRQDGPPEEPIVAWLDAAIARVSLE